MLSYTQASFMRYRVSIISLFLFAFELNAAGPVLDPAVTRALAAIRASELRGDLSFLASDALEGRFTPSPGLEVAAEFIASKFRAIGLKPGGGADYFQVADMVERTMPKAIQPVVVHTSDSTVTIDPGKIQVASLGSSLTLENAPVVKVVDSSPEKVQDMNLEGKVVMVEMKSGSLRLFNRAVAKTKALAEIVVSKEEHALPGSRFLFAEEASEPSTPLIFVQSPELTSALTGSTKMTVSTQLAAPNDEPVKVKNVIGILPGSDPKLKKTCVMVTAHYDHIGTTKTGAALSGVKPSGDDHIYNGANDDGSGTVSVIEIARAIAMLHPRRSIVFMTFFGEERGLLGSTYYGKHSVFPIAKTVADINLEQVGRTDSTEGPEISNASLTGYDYSDVTQYLERAGKLTGVSIYKDTSASDQYFVRSDNAALAEQGVPAHSLTTAFEYPDYHGLGDEWQKIDYDNMAKVDRTVALAVYNIANATKPPEWNAENPKTKPFRDAQAKFRLPAQMP